MLCNCVGPSAWGAVSKSLFCVTVFGLSMQIGPVQAQSGQALPPVTVDAPKPQTVRPTQPSRRVARSRGTTRRVAAPVRQQVVEQDAARGGAGVERANGPVVGYLASQSATATKTDTPILTTPQSISVVTKDQVEAQGAQNITEALRYTPGVTVSSFGANAFFDSFASRRARTTRSCSRLPIQSRTSANRPRLSRRRICLILPAG